MVDSYHPNHAGYVRTAEKWNALLMEQFAQ
jgi:hypothetical protein